jgi:hypothetical protein
MPLETRQEEAPVVDQATITATSEETAAQQRTKTRTEEVELTPVQQRAFDKRLGKEIAKLRRESDERLLDAIGRLNGGKQQQQEASTASATTKEDKEPREEDFTDYKEFTRALARFEVRQERKAEEQRQHEARTKEEQTAHTEQRNTVIAEHNERLEDARDRFDDFDDVLAETKVQVTQWIGDAIMESDDGPDLMYYLAQHPDEAQKLNEMRPASALRQLERIAAKVSETSREGEAETTEAEAEVETSKPVARVPAKPATPAPIRPIRKSAPTATGLSDDLPIDEWMRRRNAQKKN